MSMNLNKTTPEFSPTFCVYPWIEFILGPTEHIKLCCIASKPLEDQKGKAYVYGDSSLEDYWNSYGLRKVRKKMLSGEKLQECDHCYYQESIGRQSYRQIFNKEWLIKSEYKKHILQRIEKSKKNGFTVKEAPLYLDIRPGNLCNLKCRMCNPGNSSKIYKEQKDMLKTNSLELTPLIDTTYFNQNEKDFHNWYKKPELWDSIYKWAKESKKLYFTGGEPTLIKENWNLINYLTQKGYSKNIHLIFNINCTQAPDKLINTFDSFATVNITFSLDGYKDVQEYIRYPSKWKEIEDNISDILKNRKENTQFHVSPVVQFYNILDLTHLLTWIDKLQINYGKIGNSMIMCTGPEFLDIAVLPNNIKREALLRIENYERSYKGKDSFLLECLGAIKNVLKAKEKKDIKQQLKRFYKYTILLDQKRNNSFEKTFPDLNQLLEEDGRWKN